MFRSIEEYLDQLRTELKGCDPATIQDALSDAEEHLRTALDQALEDQTDRSATEALQLVLEQYGTPAEVAAAYKEIETRVTPPLAPPKQPDERDFITRFFGVFTDPRAYASLFYMLFSLITGIIYFTWAVTGLSLCAGFVVLIIGLPFFALFLLSVQGIALVEGRIVEALLGVRMPRRPIFSRKHLNIWDRFKALVSDKRSWAPIIYMVVMLPLGVIYFTLFITMLSFGLAGIAQPITTYVFDLPVAHIYNMEFYPPAWLMPFFVIVGVIWIFLTMHLAKAIGRLHGSIAKALLVME